MSGAEQADDRPWDVRFFSSETTAPRARRPTDVALLAVSLLVGSVVTVIAPGPTAVDRVAAAVIAAVPGEFAWFWQIAFDLLLFWGLALAVAAALARGRRYLLIEQVTAIACAFAGAALAGGAAGVSWSQLVGALVASRPPEVYPAMRLALAAAIIVTTSPHLTRPLRHIGRWVIACGGVAGIATGVTTALGLVGGLAVGMGAGAVAHLVFGSPGGRLPLLAVDRALADLGVAMADLRHAPFAPRGVALVEGHTTSNLPVLVKVYGRDAWEGQLLASVWSALWYRETTPSSRLNRLQQVVHEAYATLLAERAGVPVLPVVAAGMANGRDAVLVLEADAVRADARGQEITDGQLAGWWAGLATLHSTGIAHGSIAPERLVLRRDGTPALSDFGAAVAAASATALRADRAELLVSTALLADPRRDVGHREPGGGRRRGPRRAARSGRRRPLRARRVRAPGHLRTDPGAPVREPVPRAGGPEFGGAAGRRPSGWIRGSSWSPSSPSPSWSSSSSCSSRGLAV